MSYWSLAISQETYCLTVAFLCYWTLAFLLEPSYFTGTFIEAFLFSGALF